MKQKSILYKSDFCTITGREAALYVTREINGVFVWFKGSCGLEYPTGKRIRRFLPPALLGGLSYAEDKAQSRVLEWAVRFACKAHTVLDGGFQDRAYLDKIWFEDKPAIFTVEYPALETGLDKVYWMPYLGERYL